MSTVARESAGSFTLSLTASVMEAVHEITAKKIGMTAVIDEEGRAAGIFTEGDLRRLLERVGDVRSLRVEVTRPNLTVRARRLVVPRKPTIARVRSPRESAAAALGEVTRRERWLTHTRRLPKPAFPRAPPGS